MARRAWFLLALAVVACSRTSPTTVKPKASPARVVAEASAAPSKAPVASPTPAASATPAGLDASRQASLLDALANAAAASRAAKVTSTMSEISGVLSNNAAGLIANNAGNLIGDGGGSLISDHGGAYALLSTATPTPGPLDQPFEPTHLVSETSTLVYKVDADQPTTGGFKSYDKALYHAGKLDEGLVDDFSWDDVKNQPSYNGKPDQLAVEYHLKKNSSKRVAFADRLISRQIFRIGPNAKGDGVDSVTIGWEIEFALDVALLSGTPDHANFKAVAGEHDITKVPASDGSTLDLPNNLALTGSNPRGAYTGSIAVPDGAPNVTITHAADAGAQTQLSIKTALDGTTTEVVTVPGAHLVLTAHIDAKGGGSGVLEDSTGSKALKLGDVTWDADGVATIALADGTSLKARLF